MTKTFFLLAALLLFFQSGVFAQESKQVEEGRKLFIEKRCYICHTIKAEEQLIKNEKAAFAKSKGLDLEAEKDKTDKKKKGGDLSHVGEERDAKWIQKFIPKPRNYFKDTPDCKRLAKKKHRKRFKGTDRDLKALVAYISGLKYEQKVKKAESCLKEQAG